MSRKLYGVEEGLYAVANGLYRVAPLESIVDDFQGDPQIWSSDGSGTWGVTNGGVGDDYWGFLIGVKRVWSHPSWGQLDYYPQSGDFFEFKVKPANWSGQTRFYYGRNDTDGWTNDLYYSLQFYNDGTFRLMDSDGTAITETYSSGMVEGEEYRIKIWWHHPDYASDHRIKVEDMNGVEVLTIQGDDNAATRSSGGIMMYANEGAEMHIDDIKINERTQ